MARKKLTKAQTIKKINVITEYLFQLWEDKLTHTESFSKSLNPLKVVDFQNYLISFRKRVK
jgi:hypothetical protein